MSVRSLLLLGVAVGLAYAQAPITRTQIMMGTYVSITLESSKKALFAPAFATMKAVEMALSSYDKKAEIYQLNQHRQSAISLYTYEALRDAKRYYSESDGAFDISVGSITKELYRFGEAQQIPSSAALQKAVINFKGIHFNSTKAWLDRGVCVDLGGMGKGYGVDKVAQFLKSRGVEDAQIRASGDIKCFQSCAIAIQNPFGDGTVAQFQTQLPYSAISTSGNYERYVEDTSHNHLIDPKQKRAANNFASITLVGTFSNGDLDAYATAASVMEYDAAIAFLEKRDVWYFLVGVDGAITYKPSETFIKNLVISKP